jgi:phage-related protein
VAVNIGSAVGYLDLDISGFLSNIKSAQSEAEKVANSMSQKIGGTMQSIGDSMAKVGKFATASITTPIVTAVTASVKQFANLEQSIGGIETLFKSSAQTVISNAETAYKRAGVDANDYMEQVTSFSATLLQGLGGDTKKAADYADKAVVDMSDNANKMGTDIGLIQNAYQGFAKDNYTMLDNLKLGYGGTAGEMARLINDSGVLKGKFKATAENVKDIPFDTLIEAIHVTQENLGITGTTAKEASETVSGSFQMAKSSVFNFLQQLGNPGADMDKFADEMIKSIDVFVQNVKRVLLTIWDNLPISPLQKKLLVAAAAFGPILLAAGKVTSVVGGLFTSFDKITSVFTKLAPAAASAGTATAGAGTAATGAGAGFTAALGPILAIIAAIAVLVAAFANLWKTNEEFRNKMTAIWDGLKAKFEGFCQGIVDRLNALGFDFENITEVLKAIWDGFCQFLAPIFEGAFNIISSVLGTVMDVLTGILDVFIGIFTGNWEQCWNGVKEIFKGIWDGIVGILSAVGNMLFGLFETILGWFGTSWDETWTNIKQFFVDIWNGITTFFSNVINSIKTAVSNFITTIINFFAQLPTNIANFITNAYNSVVTWASNMVAKAGEMGQNFLNSVVSFFTNLPYKVGYFIGNTLANIVIWVSNMVDKAKEMGTNFINNVVSFFTQLPGKVLQFITSAFNNVKTWATNMVNKAREMGTNFINNIVSFFTQLPGKVLQFITSAFNNVQTWATNMANKAREMGTNFINNVVSFLTQLPGKVKGFLDSVIENAKTWVSQMGQKGKEAIKSLISNIVNAAKTIPSKMAEIGKNIVEGVWNGIKNAAGWFTDQVKGFFSGIVDGVKSALGIGSPSKVFRDEIGKWLPPGVAQGFKAALPAAMNSMEKDLNKGIDSIEPDDVSVTATATAIGFKDTIKSIYDDLVGYFESVEARIGRSVNNMAASLAMLIQQGQMMVNSDGTLGYVGYGGFTNNPNSDKYTERDDSGKPKSGDGDTFIFNSPKAIDEIEAARQMKKTKQDMAEGF